MKAQDTIFSEKIARIFNPNGEAMVMGILNITPDSFHDGGKYLSEKEWLLQTERMVSEGADIIDIGGQSTRPGAIIISEEEEETRLIPVVKSVGKHFPELLISVDTFRSSVAAKAIESGANIINDISGGTFDADMFPLIARLDVPYVLMHIKGSLETMHQENIKEDAVKEVVGFLETQANKLKALGARQIIIDPGFGFGKTLDQNYKLLSGLPFLKPLSYPILVGISRKSMITKLLNIKREEALSATTALNIIALQGGAKIIRVHDVKEAKQAVQIASKLL